MSVDDKIYTDTCVVQSMTMREDTYKGLNHAYIAGFFDGEGSAIITYTFYPERKGDPINKRRIACRISIPNRDKETLEWMQEIMNGMGHIYARPKPKDKLHWHQVYDWSIKSFPEMLQFAELISPFVRNALKKRKLNILMEYCKLRLSKSRHNGKGDYRHCSIGKEEFALLGKFMEVGSYK